MGSGGARRTGWWWVAFGLSGLGEMASCGGSSPARESGAAGGDVATGGRSTAAAGGSSPSTGGGVWTGGRGGTGASAPTGGVSGADDGGASGAPGGSSPGCANPVAWSSNLERCDGFFVHRPVAGMCALPTRDEALPNLPADAGIENLRECDGAGETCMGQNDCTRDADCGAGGYCIRDEYDNYDRDHVVVHVCHVSCRSDVDCLDGEVCACESAVQNASRETISIGRCHAATCRTDVDCGASSLCISPLNPIPDWSYGSALETFHCQAPSDECHGPTSCPNDGASDCCPEPACAYSDDRFVCEVRETCDPC